MLIVPALYGRMLERRKVLDAVETRCSVNRDRWGYIGFQKRMSTVDGISEESENLTPP